MGSEAIQSETRFVDATDVFPQYACQQHPIPFLKSCEDHPLDPCMKEGSSQDSRRLPQHLFVLLHARDELELLPLSCHMNPMGVQDWGRNCGRNFESLNRNLPFGNASLVR